MSTVYAHQASSMTDCLTSAANVVTAVGSICHTLLLILLLPATTVLRLRLLPLPPPFYSHYTHGCICQISLGGSKFWLLKSTTVLMHRYIESRPPLAFFNSSRGVRNFRGKVQLPQPPNKYSLDYTEQPALAGTPVKNFAGTKFYSQHVLADGNEHYKK